MTTTPHTRKSLSRLGIFDLWNRTWKTGEQAASDARRAKLLITPEDFAEYGAWSRITPDIAKDPVQLQQILDTFRREVIQLARKLWTLPSSPVEQRRIPVANSVKFIVKSPTGPACDPVHTFATVAWRFETTSARLLSIDLPRHSSTEDMLLKQWVNGYSALGAALDEAEAKLLEVIS